MNWPTVSLAEVCRPRRELVEPSLDGSNRYVGLEHLDSGRTTIRRFGQDNEVRSTKHRFQRNDVLFGKLRPYLRKAALAEWPGVCSTDILVLEPIEDADPEFLAFLALSPRVVEHAVATTEGVNHPRTSWAALARLRLPMPPPSEQRWIARVGKQLELAIRNTGERIQALAQLKASTMQKLFSEGPTSGSQQETAIGPLPRHWTVSPLIDVLELHRGYDLPAREREAGDFPVISSSGVHGKHSCSKVSGPGVVTGRYGTIGRVFFVEQDFWPLNTTLYVSDFKGNDPRFVSFLLERMNITYGNDKSAVPGVNRNDLHELLVPLPPLGEQKTIGYALTTIETEITRANSERVAREHLLHATLRLLTSGETLVTPLLPS